MRRSLTRMLFLVVAVLLAAGPAPAEAGVFRNLLDKVGKTMTDFNNDMWTGENSVGATAWKHEGGFFKTFDNTVAAFGRVQANAAANLKEVWTAVKDIVLWLPRKIGAVFKKLMDKVNNFRDTLNGMNQGATVKDRWKNLTGGGGGGGAPTVSAFSAPSEPAFEPPSQPSGGADGGDMDLADLDALLSEDVGRASVDAEGPSAPGSSDPGPTPIEDVADILAEFEELPEGVPSAPRASAEAGAPGAQAFPKMFRLSTTIKEADKRKEAAKRIRMAWVTTVDQALSKRQVQGAADLIKSSGELYTGNPAGMQKAMEVLAKRHPRYAKSLTRTAKRLANTRR